MAAGSNTAAALRDLQQRLKQVTEERDALQKDVEALCLSNGGSMFSGSYVLSEQIVSVQRELREAKRDLQASQARAKEAEDEVAQLKAGHGALEHALLAAKQEAGNLSSERDFFQANAARAVADVQAAQQELEALRARLAEVELQLGDAEAAAASEGRGRRDAEAALAQRQQQVAQVRRFAGGVVLGVRVGGWACVLAPPHNPPTLPLLLLPWGVCSCATSWRCARASTRRRAASWRRRARRWGGWRARTRPCSPSWAWRGRTWSAPRRSCCSSGSRRAG